MAQGGIMFENLWIRAATFAGALLIAGMCEGVVSPPVASALSPTSNEILP
jgi:hypothetical protein